MSMIMLAGGITLEKARKHLKKLLKAERVLLEGGQSYQIGGRMLTRARFADIRNSIKYWENKIAELENIKKYGGRNKAIRAIPRDL